MCFPDRTYQVFDILTFMSILDVPETLPLPPALLIPPRLLNQYYLDASIGGKTAFTTVGPLGWGNQQIGFHQSFFQVWIFGGGCFMFKHPHEEPIEKIEHFEAVLNFSVVFFFGNGSFSKKNTGERLKYVKDRQISSCAGICMLDHLPSNIGTVGAVKHIPNQPQSYTSPLVIPNLFCISTPYHFLNKYTQQRISAIAQYGLSQPSSKICSRIGGNKWLDTALALSLVAI